jgi:hypothetical protein
LATNLDHPRSKHGNVYCLHESGSRNLCAAPQRQSEPLYAVNPTRKTLRKKAAKTDVAAIEYLVADLDPNDDETPEEAKARYARRLEEFEPKPTLAIDSGNGLQLLWRLASPIVLSKPESIGGKPAFSAADQTKVDDIEARIKCVILQPAASGSPVR